MIKVLVVACLLPRLFGQGVVMKQPVPRMLNTANCSAEWQQCGGTDWAGSVCCQEGLWCFVQNEWYSQCLSSGSTTTTHSVQVTSSELSTTSNDKSNSVDCVAEHNNAVNNGNIPCFCNRCANEGGADPLRNRCQLCYDVCNMSQVYNTTECPNWQNNKSDCVTEHENAVHNGNISAFCNRCANEGGADPLRDRCQLCYDVCNMTNTTESPNWQNNRSDCVTEHENAVNNGNISAFCNRCANEGGADPLRDRCQLCYDVCNMPSTTESPAGQNNSVDCLSEHNNAVSNANIPCFCNRCANEGGANPLRNRCQLCYDVCNMSQVYNTTECPNWQNNRSDCVTEHENAVNNGNISAFCNRCANEGGADPLRDRCQLCYDVCNMTSTTESPAGQNNRSDCVVEHENAVNNGNISAFCNRCANEGGANPLRDRCQLCYDACDELEPGPSPSVAYDGECRGNDSRCSGSSQVRCLNLGAQGADCWWDSFDPLSTGTCTGNDSRCHWAVSEQACASLISEGADCVWREDFSLTGHVDMEVTGEVDVDEMEGAVEDALSSQTGVPPDNIDVDVILERRLEGKQLRQLQTSTTMRAFWSILVDSNVFSVTRDSSEMSLQVSNSNNLEAAILSDLRGKHASEDLKVIVKNVGDVQAVIVSRSTSTPNTDSNNDDKTTPATIVSALSTTKRMGTTEPDYKALEDAIDSSQSGVLNLLIVLPALVTLL